MTIEMVLTECEGGCGNATKFKLCMECVKEEYPETWETLENIIEEATAETVEMHELLYAAMKKAEYDGRKSAKGL